MGNPVYKRILLKLSGEALDPRGRGGIDFETVGGFCEEIAAVRAMKVDVGLVVGGGNIFRGSPAAQATGLDQPTCDYMGMLATVINALAIQGVLEKKGVATRVMTAIEMRPVAEPYIRRRAIRHIEKGRVVIFGAGTGNPFFTTDTAAALRAHEIGAEILFKATKVDGIYDSDPKRNHAAQRYEELSYTTMLARNLGAMDATAVSLCREKKMPILVFNLTQSGSISQACRGERIGTIVRGD
ncbi:MAG: UMP kinase [Candidatus Hydrogenedentes bacterium]|nr:UMP kinase [Candidatus Hydrogenedentota bacterium]